MSAILDAILAAGNGNAVDQLAQQFGTNPGQTRDALSPLTAMLDANRDGSIADDLMNLAGRLLR